MNFALIDLQFNRSLLNLAFAYVLVWRLAYSVKQNVISRISNKLVDIEMECSFHSVHFCRDAETIIGTAWKRGGRDTCVGRLPMTVTVTSDQWPHPAGLWSVSPVQIPAFPPSHYTRPRSNGFITSLESGFTTYNLELVSWPTAIVGLSY